MYEDTNDYNFCDDILGTFTTSGGHKESIQSDKLNMKVDKRHSSESDKENVKKTKLDYFDLPPNKNIPMHTGGSPSMVVKRLFPGPAGILLDNCDNEVFLCSQQTSAVFETGPWQEMVADFQDSHGELLFEKFNINWIKSNFSIKKQLVNKAPFLASTIDSLELTDGKIPTVRILLKDRMGTIQSTIVHSLYKKYLNYLTVGSVLVLIQFGVLYAEKSHCLTITPNNLLTIYHQEVKKLSEDEKYQKTEVKKIIVQKYTIDDIWRSCNYKSSSCKTTKFQVPEKAFLNNLTHTRSFETSKNVSSIKNNQVSTFTFKKSTNEIKAISESTRPHLNVENLDVGFGAKHISIKTDKAHSEIWKDLFEEVDTDALLGDF